MVLETERLILRPWEDGDAEDLYRYASHPDVGPVAGWPIHTSVENSLEIIHGVLSELGTYAIVLKEVGHVVGSIGLKLGDATDLTGEDDECELGYWLGVPYWGHGIMSEATKEMLRYAFEDIGMKKVWSGYYDGNNKSKRVQEKCGFHYQWTTEDVEVPLMNEFRTGHVGCLTKEEWMNNQ